MCLGNDLEPDIKNILFIYMLQVLQKISCFQETNGIAPDTNRCDKNNLL